MDKSDPQEPWALLPSEVVCLECRYAHHKHLDQCPTCKERNQ